MSYTLPQQSAGRLVSRIAPFPGESLVSILARASHVNAFESVVEVLALLGLRVPLPGSFAYAKYDKSSIIATLLNLEDADISSRMHQVLSNGCNGAVNWYGTSIPRTYINASRRRISPSSLKTSPHHRDVWALKPLSFCPESFELLTSECPYCEGRLAWSQTLGPWRCEHCRRSLRHTSTETVPFDLRTEAAAAAGLLSTDAEIRANALRYLPDPFRQWGAGEAFQAIVELAAIAECEVPELAPNEGVRWWRGGFAGFGAKQLVDGYRFLCEWPDSLENYVKEINSGKNVISRTRMGRLSKFFIPTAPPTAIGNLIREMIPNTLGELNVPIKSTRGGKVFGANRSKTVTITEASELVGIKSTLLRHLLGAGKSFVAEHPGRRGVRLFDKEMITRSGNIYKESLSLNEVSSRIGVPWYCIPMMANMGYISLVSDHDALLIAGGEPRVVGRSINELNSQLLALPTVCGLRGESLAVKMAGTMVPATWVRVIEGLLSGSLRLLAQGDDPRRPLDGMLVEADALKAILKNSSDMAAPEVCVSRVAAAKILRLPYVVVCDAAAKGLLGANGRNPKFDLSLIDVQKFSRRFVGTLEGSTMVGVKTADLRSCMALIGFRPAHVIARNAIWRRSHVNQAAEYPKIEGDVAR